MLLGPLGPLLDASWAVSGASWTQLGKKAVGITFLGSNLEAKIQPGWLQNPQAIDVEKQLDFNAFSSYVFHIFQRFPLQSKIVDFVKNSVFSKENHYFWILDGPGKTDFLILSFPKKIDFGSKKTFQNWGQNPLKSI